jgi:hypothetical protein
VPLIRRLVAGFPPRRPVFEPGSGHVGFVMDKVALGQCFSEYMQYIWGEDITRTSYVVWMSGGSAVTSSPACEKDYVCVTCRTYR